MLIQKSKVQATRYYYTHHCHRYAGYYPNAVRERIYHDARLAATVGRRQHHALRPSGSTHQSPHSQHITIEVESAAARAAARGVEAWGGAEGAWLRAPVYSIRDSPCKTDGVTCRRLCISHISVVILHTNGKYTGPGGGGMEWRHRPRLSAPSRCSARSTATPPRPRHAAAGGRVWSHSAGVIEIERETRGYEEKAHPLGSLCSLGLLRHRHVLQRRPQLRPVPLPALPARRYRRQQPRLRSALLRTALLRTWQGPSDEGALSWRAANRDSLADVQRRCGQAAHPRPPEAAAVVGGARGEPRSADNAACSSLQGPARASARARPGAPETAARPGDRLGRSAANGEAPPGGVQPSIHTAALSRPRWWGGAWRRQGLARRRGLARHSTACHGCGRAGAGGCGCISVPRLRPQW
jgi:hypothetical protein